MADRTHVTVIVKGVVPELQAEVQAAIEEYASFEYVDDDWENGKATFQDNEVVLGSGEALSKALDAINTARFAPDFAYAIFEDPKYEFEGACYYSVPGAGYYVGTCDANGQVYVTATQINFFVDQYKEIKWKNWGEQPTLARRLEDLTGRRIVETFEKYGERHGG